jgi:hypothetical protein
MLGVANGLVKWCCTVVWDHLQLLSGSRKAAAVTRPALWDPVRGVLQETLRTGGTAKEIQYFWMVQQLSALT